jgi:glycosyltransferase involved in cell wall biosynthesis
MRTSSPNSGRDARLDSRLDPYLNPHARAYFLTPEAPEPTSGGGMRSASVLAYLRTKYEVDVASVDVPPHTRGAAARVSRNVVRFIRARPPLFDRYAGHRLIFEGKEFEPCARYRVAVAEHFWSASYAGLLRPHTDLLVLDLHNVESALARSCARGILKPAFSRFSSAYERLERECLPKFDVVLVASEEDRARVERLRDGHPCFETPRVVVYPNALCPALYSNATQHLHAEAHAIVFSGNLEYHPNVEAVRWFHRNVWPLLREEDPALEWRLVGRNPGAIRRIVENDRRIRIVGPVENAMAEIAAAKVSIVPLLSGSGTRFKILEAWAAHRAVVSTTIGAEGLGATSGEHLLIADSAEAFGNTIIAALKSAEIRRKLGDNGHSLYQARYTWPTAWKALEEAGI